MDERDFCRITILSSREMSIETNVGDAGVEGDSGGQWIVVIVLLYYLYPSLGMSLWTFSLGGAIG